FDNGLDRIDHILGAEAGPGDLADRGLLVGRAAERAVVGLLPFPLETQNADMTDVMMAAGIDAAGDLDLERTDLFRALALAEALSDPLRDRDRARGRQRAIVEAGAGDDIADRAGVRRRQADRREAIV